MATYIKGVTDELPGPTSMAPDYKLLSATLSTLQAKYDKGFDQVKTAYNSLINKPLSSADNEQFRQDYLKKADAALSQLSGVDLSNPNNVAQAITLFDPLVKDKQYATDLYKTSAQQAQINQMLQVKNSTDPKVREQYNPIMEEYLTLGAERLSKTKRDDGSIERAAVHQYAPWVDPVKYASDRAKELNLSIETVTPEGLYLKDVVNGEKSYIPYKNWFDNTITNQFDNQFRIESEVINERAVKNLMATTPNMTREQALQKLGTDFSGEYVKLYNGKIDDYKSTIDEANAKINTYKRTYKTKVPPQVADEIRNLEEQKSSARDSMNLLVREKGTDADLQKKAVDLYLKDPAGAYMSKVKDDYAKKFAYNEAYGKMKIEYKADPVALQLQNQQFEMGKLALIQKHDLLKLQYEHQYRLQEAIAEGKIKTQQTGASVGQPTDVGALPVEQNYLNTMTKHFEDGTLPYANSNVLAVAGGWKVDKSGGITLDKNSTFTVKDISDAVTILGKGMALNPEQSRKLKDYLDTIVPGNNFNPTQRGAFGILQQIIHTGLRKNKGTYGELGPAVTQLIDNASASRHQYVQMWDEARTSLTSKLSDPELKPYILRFKDGGMSINYNKVNQLDKKDRDYIYSKLIPNYDRYLATSSKKMNTVILNPKDPKEFDYSIFRNAIVNSEKAGVMVNNEFVPFNEEQLSKFREITLGGGNLSQVFDPSGTMYERKVVNGVDYIKVTIPVLRKPETQKGGGSLAQSFGMDMNGKMAESNQVSLLVPVGKAGNLAGNDVLIKDPITNSTQRLPNDFRELIGNLAQESLVDNSLSWVSNNGLLRGGVSNFDIGLTSKIPGGRIYATNGALKVDFDLDSGETKTIDISNALGISYEDYLKNPAANDTRIRNWITNTINSYDVQNMRNMNDKINSNNVSAMNNASWVEWSKLKITN